MDFRLGARARTTKDMDLARADDEDAATADFLAAQSMDAGDHFVFVIEKARRLGPRVEGAVRYHVRAELAGRPFEETVVDVGFSDPFPESVDRLRGPGLLSFADIEPVEVPALPLEAHVAEKVHAYTRTYGDATDSTRVKDLVDLVLIHSFAALDAARLQTGLHRRSKAAGDNPCPSTCHRHPRTGRRRTGDSPPRSESIPSFGPATQRQRPSSIPSSPGATGGDGHLTDPRGTIDRPCRGLHAPGPN